MISKQANYYDAVYRDIISKRGVSGEWIDERNKFVLPHIDGCVLDIGCGLGEIENLITGEYTGIDISTIAVEYAINHRKNTSSKFYCMGYDDAEARWHNAKYDTVIMLEILEHLHNPELAVKAAVSLASKKIVVTVPRDMPGRAHVHPRWSPDDLMKLLGNLEICELFGGPDLDRWWLAVAEVK